MQRNRTPTSRLAWLGVLLLALAISLLAWPRFLAALKYLPVERAIEQYYDTSEIASERLPVLIRYAQESIGILDHYRFHNGLGLLQMIRARDRFTPALERRSAYRQAEQESVASLRMAPAQPSIWLQLALIRWILRDEPEDILDAWKMSIFTDRTNSSLYVLRLEIGLAFWQNLDSEGQAMLRDQVQVAWRVVPGSIIQVLNRRDPDLAILSGLLEDTAPTTLEEMHDWLEKIR